MLRDEMLAQIDDQLRKLPTEKLVDILNFVESQAARQFKPERRDRRFKHDALLASDWGHLEEPEAWRNL